MLRLPERAACALETCGGPSTSVPVQPSHTNHYDRPLQRVPRDPRVPINGVTGSFRGNGGGCGTTAEHERIVPSCGLRSRSPEIEHARDERRPVLHARLVEDG